MIITKEQFDSLQVGDELENDIKLITVEFKMANVIITYNSGGGEVGGYTFKDLANLNYQLKPKTQHLYGFLVGSYEDKNVFVSVSDESLEKAKEVFRIRKLLEVTKNNFKCIVDGSIGISVSEWKYAVLLSDNVELVKE